MSFFKNLFLRPQPILSVEFFPPKNAESIGQFRRAAAHLAGFSPDFASITYGAGGSSQDLSLTYGKLLREEHGFEVLPHLTCVGATRGDLQDVLEKFNQNGFAGVMALRGDPPRGTTNFAAQEGGFRFANELVGFVREQFPAMEIGVAGYPETHPEAPSPGEDLRNLQRKVAAGANFITTQLFFENSHYFSFVERCRQAGITIPILPGILPALSLGQVSRFCAMCGSTLPPALARRLEAAPDEEAAEEAGIDWAFAQIKDLLARGAPGTHLYILNRSRPAMRLLRRLRGLYAQ